MMQFFLFLILAIFLCIVLISLMTPVSSAEEEEPEFWEATDVRLETLLDNVAAPDPGVREVAYNQILSMGASVIPRLINGLSQELCFAQPNKEWCAQVESVLSHFGLQAIPALLQWLREEGDNPDVVQAVQRILLAYDTPALRIIMSRMEPILLPHLVPVFLAWGESAAPLVLRAFREEPRRKLWQQLLLELHAHSVSGLMAGMKQWSGEVKEQAFFVLARIAPVQAIGLFEEALQDTDIHKKTAAIRAIERSQQEQTWPRLVPLLNDPAEEVRALSIQVIAKLGKQSATEVLKNLREQIRSQPERLHEALLLAVVLATLGEPVDTELLELGLQSKLISRQQLVLQLIGHLPAEERAVFLVPLLDNSAESIIVDVVRMLLELHDPHALERVLQRFRRSPQGNRLSLLIEAELAKMGEWAVSYLCQVLTDPHRDRRIRALVLRTLLSMGDQRSLEPVLSVIQMVTDPEEEWGVVPQDVYGFLKRLERHHNIHQTLQNFLADNPASAMAPALRLFLEQSTSSSRSSLSLDTQSTKI